jgi:hypothetical protein
VKSMRNILEERAVVDETGRERVDCIVSADVSKRKHGTIALEQWPGCIEKLCTEGRYGLGGRRFSHRRGPAAEERGGRRCWVDGCVRPAIM